MNNNLTVSELLGKLDVDLQHWERKRQAAEGALLEATAKTQELTQTLNNLRRYLPDFAVPPSIPIKELRTPGEFSGMSTREAIKIVLQRAGRALSSADVAQQLIHGGVTSESASFRSNVSATLSVMQSKYHEVQKTPGGWILSQPSLMGSESGGEAAA